MLWAENFSKTEATPISHRNRFSQTIQPDDVIFFNHSIYDPILPKVANLPNRKILYFHNITPPELIDPADPETVENCRKGLLQLPLFVEFDAVIANSSATLRMVQDALQNTIPVSVVAPPVIGFDRFSGMMDRQSTFTDLPTLLNVGRLVPHKGGALVIEVFDKLKDRRPDLELHFVGGPDNSTFVKRLKSRAAEVSDRIKFYHDVSDSQLAELYQRAECCINLSSHEGFCVPALDSLFFDKPFFFRGLPAVREIMAEAALCLPDEPYAAADEIMRFTEKQHRRAEHIRKRSILRERWRQIASGQPIMEILRRVLDK
jgi:glycosyltransferase involved in cell wall biosynthesis